MVVEDFEDRDGSDGRPVKAAVRLSRRWIVCWLEDEPLPVGQVKGELPGAFGRQLMALAGQNAEVREAARSQTEKT